MVRRPPKTTKCAGDIEEKENRAQGLGSRGNKLRLAHPARFVIPTGRASGLTSSCLFVGMQLLKPDLQRSKSIRIW